MAGYTAPLFPLGKNKMNFKKYTFNSLHLKGPSLLAGRVLWLKQSLRHSIHGSLLCLLPQQQGWTRGDHTAPSPSPGQRREKHHGQCGTQPP